LGERALLEGGPLLNAGGRGFAGFVVDGERLRWGGAGAVFRDVENVGQLGVSRIEAEGRVGGVGVAVEQLLDGVGDGGGLPVELDWLRG
jgi:hypothetical protein